jgi:hypothetical protein
MYSSGLVVGSWVEIGDGRPIRFEVGAAVWST